MMAAIDSDPFSRFEKRLNILTSAHISSLSRSIVGMKSNFAKNKQLMNSLLLRLQSAESNPKKNKRLINRNKVPLIKKSRISKSSETPVDQIITNSRKLKHLQRNRDRFSEPLEVTFLEELKELPSLHPTEIENVLGSGDRDRQYLGNEMSKQEPIFPPPPDALVATQYPQFDHLDNRSQHIFPSRSLNCFVSEDYYHYIPENSGHHHTIQNPLHVDIQNKYASRFSDSIPGSISSFISQGRNTANNRQAHIWQNGNTSLCSYSHTDDCSKFSQHYLHDSPFNYYNISSQTAFIEPKSNERCHQFWTNFGKEQLYSNNTFEGANMYEQPIGNNILHAQYLSQLNDCFSLPSITQPLSNSSFNHAPCNYSYHTIKSSIGRTYPPDFQGLR